MLTHRMYCTYFLTLPVSIVGIGYCTSMVVHFPFGSFFVVRTDLWHARTATISFLLPHLRRGEAVSSFQGLDGMEKNKKGKEKRERDVVFAHI